jgi:hypothetical protein
MKVRLLVGGVLVDEAEHTYGELYTEHNVTKERGEYLVSIGAAEELKAPAKKAPAKADSDDDKKAEEKTEPAPAPAAPARKPAPRAK